MATEILDKHTWLAENVLPKQEYKPRRNKLENIRFHTVSRKTKIVMCIMGCWGVYFPPYNIARLTALVREAGYDTKVFDFNVESYHELKSIKLDEGWNSNNHYWWFDGEYETRIHLYYMPLMLNYVDRILAENPDVIGFSVYDTNKNPSEWMATEIKKRNPNVKIIFGGPNCHMPNYIPCESVDHWVAGEGEQVFIDFLEKTENNIEISDRRLGSTFGDTRIDIDSLPFPDYTDYDLSKYTSSYGISAELSRGCVAKCSFCRETWFWKYRDRASNKILDEIEYQCKTYGINFIWFIDSLTNGNLKELRGFAKGVIERELKISWMGYARCDGRMDLDYYKDLKASGCVNLSYGIESGSQKVLDLMRKNIKISDVDENLINGAKVGIFSHANWIVGAPAEDIQAMAHSLNLIWNHRNRIGGISPGVTLGDSKQTDYEFNRDRYNMSPWDRTFLNKWWSLDWSNTKIHRFIRLKYFYIWLIICKEYGIIDNNQYRPTIVNHYELKFDSDTHLTDNLKYEDFDHMIMKPNLGEFADTVINEIWGFLRMIWRARGGFEINLEFDPKTDLEEFGDYIADNYRATHWFKINNDGNFEARHTYQFTHNGEWWMRGTKSFIYKWEGQGKWNDDSFTILKFTEEGTSNRFNETLPLNAKSGTKFIETGKTKKFTIIDIF
jgi:radical SAM superfamily enzyme YgiQ (UPF0313 family)